MCAEVLSKRVSGQADVPLSEISGRIQETGCVHSNLQSQLIYWPMRITEQKDTRPLLADYRIMIVDEAHKLPEAGKADVWTKPVHG